MHTATCAAATHTATCGAARATAHTSRHRLPRTAAHPFATAGAFACAARSFTLKALISPFTWMPCCWSTDRRTQHGPLDRSMSEHHRAIGGACGARPSVTNVTVAGRRRLSAVAHGAHRYRLVRLSARKVHWTRWMPRTAAHTCARVIAKEIMLRYRIFKSCASSLVGSHPAPSGHRAIG